MAGNLMSDSFSSAKCRFMEFSKENVMAKTWAQSPAHLEQLILCLTAAAALLQAPALEC